MRDWSITAAVIAFSALAGLAIARLVSSAPASPERPAVVPTEPNGPTARESATRKPELDPADQPDEQTPPERSSTGEAIEWRRSTAVGSASGGRLVRGVRLPAAGRHFFTWDPILKRSPDRPWRRWGTHFTLRRLLRVIRAFARSHPGASRVTVGDLSRPRGGDFGPRYGLPGHASHQNGLDIDVYYPRIDLAELPPDDAGQIDRPLGQDLVDRFVRAGAEYVFVGPSTGLRGPAGIVQVLVNHDDHMHVRFPSRETG